MVDYRYPLCCTHTHTHPQDTPLYKKKYLTSDAIRGLVARQLAEERIAKAGNPYQDVDPQMVAHLFWTSASNGVVVPSTLTPVSAIGLRTDINAGFEDNLWSFDPDIKGQLALQDARLASHPKLVCKDASGSDPNRPRDRAYTDDADVQERFGPRTTSESFWVPLGPRGDRGPRWVQSRQGSLWALPLPSMKFFSWEPWSLGQATLLTLVPLGPKGPMGPCSRLGGLPL